MFDQEEAYSPVLDTLLSQPNLQNIRFCSCCLSETCEAKMNSASATKSISFISAAGLSDPVFIKLAPVDEYSLPSEEVMDTSAGLQSIDPRVDFKDGGLVTETPDIIAEDEPAIKEVKVVSCFRRVEAPKPPVKTEEGRRRKYARYREKQYVCDVCDRSFTLKQNIAQHFYQYHHPRLTSKQRELKEFVSRFCCTKCDKIFTDLGKAQRHEQKVHGEPPKKVQHICDRCEKVFPSPHLLQEHVSVVHENLKPFKCDLCDQTFGRSGGLRRHNLMVHEGKMFTCPYEDCDHPGYKCSKALAAHIRSKHTHERPYECLYCDKRFVRKNDLKVHEMTHSSDCLFTCSLCGQTFKRESYLRKHRMHCGLDIEPIRPNMKGTAKKSEKKSKKSKKRNW